MPRARFATTQVDANEGLFVIEWTDNEVVKVRLDGFSENMLAQLALHGLKQKVMDATNTRAESLDEAKDLAQATIGQLQAGEWTRRAEGTGGILVQALHRATGRSLDECRAATKALSAKKKRELEKVPEVAAAIAAIHEERAKAAADDGGDTTVLDDMFGE